MSTIADQLAKTQRLCDTFNAERRAERVPVTTPQVAVPPTQSAGLSDDDREIAIRWYGFLMEGNVTGGSAATPALRNYWWSLMKNLIDGRSLAQVERMERAKGLR